MMQRRPESEVTLLKRRRIYFESYSIIIAAAILNFRIRSTLPERVDVG